MSDIKKISYTELSTYTACPLKWFIRYRLNIQGQTSKSILLGSLYHEICKHILSKTISEEFYHNINEDELFHETYNITKNYIDTVCKNFKVLDEDIAYIITKSRNMPQKFLNYLKMSGFVTVTHNDKPLVECEILSPIIQIEKINAQYYIKGIIDCIVKDKKNNIILIDHKTSKKKYDDFSIFFSNQLNIYSYLISNFITSNNIDIKPNKIGYLVYTVTNNPDLTLYTSEFVDNQNLTIQNCLYIIEAMNTIKPYPTFNTFMHDFCEYKELCYKYNYFTNADYNEIVTGSKNDFLDDDSLW